MVYRCFWYNFYDNFSSLYLLAFNLQQKTKGFAMKTTRRWWMVLAVFLLAGCNDDDCVRKPVYEVDGPGGNYAWSAAFDPAMLGNWQTVYSFSEETDRWNALVFNPDGTLVRQSLKGSETAGLYRVENGKLIITGTVKDPVISLKAAHDTLWEVRGVDNDGAAWDHTWHLELKFTRDMVAGKRFAVVYDNPVDGTVMQSCIYSFNNGRLRMLGPEGVEEHPFRIREDAVAVDDPAGDYAFYLMFVLNNEFHVWYLNEGRQESASCVWLPMEAHDILPEAPLGSDPPPGDGEIADDDYDPNNPNNDDGVPPLTVPI